MLKKQMILNAWISVLFGVQSNYAWNGTKRIFVPVWMKERKAEEVGKLFWHSELIKFEKRKQQLEPTFKKLIKNCNYLNSICRWCIDIDLLQGLGPEYWARLHGATRHSALWAHDWLKCIQEKSSPILCCHTDPDTFRSAILDKLLFCSSATSFNSIMTNSIC